MAASTMELLPGTEVQARGLRWEVVSTESLGPQTMFRLRGLENAVLGQELDVLYPFEPIEPVIHELRPDRAAPLTNWLVYHQAFLLEQALGPDALLAVQPGRLKIEPYQLVPVLRAIRMSRVRLFLADGVGLGKTVQAGLVLTELIARRLAHRILVVSPAGPLLEQWKTEMSQRFGLRLEVIDRAKLEEVRRSTELGSNPFDHIPLGLVSVDFLKQERVLDQLERASYDVVVIDEAHHCMDIGRGQDREDSQRRRLAEVLSRRCDCLLLLTATPHDGNDRSFASLCELLDPSLVDGRGSLREERYRPYVVRRLKKHIRDPQTGEERFKERIVTPIPVAPEPRRHAKFIEMQKGLLDLLAPELRRAFANKTYSDVLAFIALLKRSVSTVAACKATLSVVSDRFERVLEEKVESQESRRQRRRTLREYLRKQERFGTISNEEEEELLISLGYALINGMQRHFMLGSGELDFELEGPWLTEESTGRYNMVSLAFIDPSLGGSGYLVRIAERFNRVAKRTIEHLDHPDCETACYRCLKSYQNQRHHEHLAWPQVVPALEELAAGAPQRRPPRNGDIDDPKPWLEAYAAGVGSPLELRFLRLFEKHGFHPQKQVPVSPSPSEPPISIADFAVPDRRLAIYVDGAAFHVGQRLRRDRFIRDRLRNGDPPWRVEDCRGSDLAAGRALVERLAKSESPPAKPGASVRNRSKR